MTTLSSSANPSELGQTLTFTANVSGAGGTPTGSVTFSYGSTPIATIALVNGQASANLSSSYNFGTGLSQLGTYAVSASYSGDSIFQGSVGALSQQINRASTTTVLTSSLNPSSVGQQVTLTATVTGSTIFGTISIYDGATLIAGPTPIGAQAPAGSQVQFSATALAQGTHNLTAVYNESNGVTFSSTSAVLTQTVNAGSGTATATTLSSSANPSELGQTLTFTANVSGAGGTPTGSVTFSFGSTPIATIALVNGQASANLSSSSR